MKVAATCGYGKLRILRTAATRFLLILAAVLIVGRSIGLPWQAAVLAALIAVLSTGKRLFSAAYGPPRYGVDEEEWRLVVTRPGVPPRVYEIPLDAVSRVRVSRDRLGGCWKVVVVLKPLGREVLDGLSRGEAESLAERINSLLNPEAV